MRVRVIDRHRASHTAGQLERTPTPLVPGQNPQSVVIKPIPELAYFRGFQIIAKFAGLFMRLPSKFVVFFRTWVACGSRLDS